MTKHKQTKKFALVKRMINPNDNRITKETKPTEKKEEVKQVTQVASSLFFKHNSSLGPPYHGTCIHNE